MRHRKPRFINEYIDRHGRPRVYLRRPGSPQIALPTPLYSQGFWTAYHAAMDDNPVKASRLKPGSVALAVLGYYRSLEFKSLAASTQAVYRGVLDRFRAKHGDAPIAGLQTRHVNKLIDDMADTPAAASNFRKRLSAVMDYAVSVGMRTDNPVGTAKQIKLKSPGHRTWTEEDIAAFRKHWAIGTPQRLATHPPLSRPALARHDRRRRFLPTYRKRRARLACRLSRRRMVFARQPAVDWRRLNVRRWKSCRLPATPISRRLSAIAETLPRGGYPRLRWINCRRAST